MYFIVNFSLVNECALRGNNLSIIVIITGYYLTLFFECGVSKSLMLAMVEMLLYADRQLFVSWFFG